MSGLHEKKDGINYELLYDYLTEKYKEDVALLDVKRDILSREEFYEHKTRLTETEHILQLIRKHNG